MSEYVDLLGMAGLLFAVVFILNVVPASGLRVIASRTAVAARI